jgi:purine-nucleoside phosphorylase
MEFNELILKEVISKGILGEKSWDEVDTKYLVINLGISANFEDYLEDTKKEGSLTFGNLDGVPVSVTTIFPGTLSLEFMLNVIARTKIKYIFGIGAVGALQDKVEVGDILLPIQSFRGEGMTDYYAPRNVPAKPAEDLYKELVSKLAMQDVPYHVGKCFTTSSICTETDEFIEGLVTDNYIGVDSESAALYILARHFGLKAVALLVASDHPHKKVLAVASKALQTAYGEGLDRASKIVGETIVALAKGK